MGKIVRYAFINAIATTLYIILVASFMFIGLDGVFEKSGETVFIPIAMLMLLVFSAALTGALMFGRPLMWYFDGKKSEALSLLSYTLAIFLTLTAVMFLILVLINL